MKFLKITFVILTVIVVALFGGAALLPKTVEVTRTIQVDAPRALVFQLVGNQHDFIRWSPWVALDPEMKIDFSGPAEGVGSIYTWQSSNPDLGRGSSKVVLYQPYERVETELDFGHTRGKAVFGLKMLAEKRTEVSWTYIQNFDTLPQRWFGLLMESFLAPDFERGLASLKELAQSLPAIKTEELSYEVDGVTLTGYLASPLTESKRPAVIVVHEWWGHNAYVRKRAAMLAELGYVAFALDMYGDGKLANHPKDAMGFATEIFANPSVQDARFDAALALVKSNPLSNGQVAVIGYCFGGAVALNMARKGKDLQGAVSFHGGIGQLNPINPNSQVPSLVLNGAADPFITEADKSKFKQEMDVASLAYEFIEYPDAVHAFSVKGIDELGEKFNLPLRYNAEADQASWQKMQEFFNVIFK